MLDAIEKFLSDTGVAILFGKDNWWQYIIMYVIIGALFYLAVVKKFEPLLLLPIAFGMLLANLPGAELIHLDFFFDDYYLTRVWDAEEGVLLAAPLEHQINAFMQALAEKGIDAKNIIELTTIEGTADKIYILNVDNINAEVQTLLSEAFAGVAEFDNGALHVKMSTMIKEVVNNGGLVDILYLGVKLGVYPALIFMGVGAMTDFAPLIANPKSLLMGASAQLGVFIAFFFAILIGFTPMEAGSIGIIGGADGPTAIYVTKTLAPHLLGAIAIAAYSYMALIPIIQPPFMRLLTTEEERKIKMHNLRSVSKLEKVIFPILGKIMQT